MIAVFCAARAVSLSLSIMKKKEKKSGAKERGRPINSSNVQYEHTFRHTITPCARLSQMPPYTSVHTPNRKKPVHACWTLVYSTKIRIRIPPIDGVDEEEEEEEEEVVVMMDDLRGGVLFGWQQSTSH